MPARPRDERGEIRFGLILALIVLAAAIYFAAQVIPVMYHSYAFEQEVEDIAMQAAGRRARNLSRIRDEVLMAADRHGLREYVEATARARNIKDVAVDRTTSEIKIHVEFVRPIDLIVFTWNWERSLTQARTLY
jgi:hypothetical protein